MTLACAVGAGRIGIGTSGDGASVEMTETRIYVLFDELLDLDESDRASRLREIAVRNPEVHARLVRLLDADHEADVRLRDYEQAVARVALAAAAGRRVGAWRLVEEIGHGGMGVVYRAERADGQFEQRAAIKLLRFGLTQDDLVRRFLTEREILASLQHPHIARVLDGGVTDDGTPWFAMEYVEGVPITEHCERRGLSIDECLELFERVCRVVQHAHNRLIIHRDLKPSNIFVGGDGTPHLLDFGLAKVLEDPAADVTSTHPGRRWLTLEYASPEQVRGEPLTTSSDTYQLGLILYELLAGRRPYTVKGLSPGEAESVICEREPSRPSTAAATVDRADKSPRLVLPRKLLRRLRGDLDTIVMKALHKDPDRRYASAEALADDIRRHLTGRLIHARPDTIGYRTRKFVARHRWAVGAAGLVFLSLVGGLAGTLSQARRATENARDALDAQRRAEEVTAFLVGLFEANDPSVAQGDTITARELLERGVAQAEEMTDRPELQATLFGVTARVYQSLGNVSRADELFARSAAAWDAVSPERENEDERAQTLLSLGFARYLLGRREEAEQLYREVLVLRSATEPGDPIRADALYRLFEVLHVHDRTEQADQVFAAWEEAMRHAPPATDVGAAGRVLTLAQILGFRGQVRGDVGLIRRGQTLIDDALGTLQPALGARHPMVGEIFNLKLALWEQELELQPETPSVLARADSVSQRAVELHRAIYPDPHQEMASSLFARSNVLRRLKRYDEAEVAIREYMETIDAVRGTDNIEWIEGLSQLATNLFDKGSYDAAVARQTEVSDWWVRSYGKDYVLTLRADLSLGRMLTAAGRFEEAEPLLASALARLEVQRGRDDRFTRQAIRALLELYEAWGKPDRAAAIAADSLP